MAHDFWNFEGQINLLRDECRAQLSAIMGANKQTKIAFISFVTGIVTFILFLLIPWDNLKEWRWVILSVLITSGVTGVCAFVIEYRQRISAVWENPIGKLFFALVAYVFSSEALIYSDRLIFKYTRLDPTLFPMARNLMSIYLGFLVWFRNAWPVLGLLIVVVSVFQRNQVVPDNTNLFGPVKVSQWPAVILKSGIIIGLGMMSVVSQIALNSAGSTDHVQPFSRWLIVYSSFHQNNGYCQDLPKEAKIMLFSGKEEVVHVNYAPDGSAVFSVRPCPREFNQVVP